MTRMHTEHSRNSAALDAGDRIGVTNAMISSVLPGQVPFAFAELVAQATDLELRKAMERLTDRDFDRVKTAISAIVI